MNLVDLQCGGGLDRRLVVVLLQRNAVLNHVLSNLEVILQREPLEVVGNVELDDAQVADLLREVLLRVDLRSGREKVSLLSFRFVIQQSEARISI